MCLCFSIEDICYDKVFTQNLSLLINSNPLGTSPTSRPRPKYSSFSLSLQLQTNAPNVNTNSYKKYFYKRVVFSASRKLVHTKYHENKIIMHEKTLRTY